MDMNPLEDYVQYNYYCQSQKSFAIDVEACH